jgi:hypothetical protein
MKQKRQQNPRDWHERRLEAERYQDRPRLTDGLARRGSRPTAAQRKKAGEGAGLANEPRPGLGARKKKSPAKPAKKTPARKTAKRKRTAHDKEPLGRVAPLPPEKSNQKREEQSDPFAREQERDTGVSGHMSGD